MNPCGSPKERTSHVNQTFNGIWIVDNDDDDTNQPNNRMCVTKMLQSRNRSETHKTSRKNTGANFEIQFRQRVEYNSIGSVVKKEAGLDLRLKKDCPSETTQFNTSNNIIENYTAAIESFAQ